MEPELFGIFPVKMVAKNKVLGSKRTHFVHMRVKYNSHQCPYSGILSYRIIIHLHVVCRYS